MKYLQIPGNPISQKRHRHHRFGTYDPSSGDKKRVIPIIVEQFKGRPFKSALEIELHFVCKRPKSHYGTGKNADTIKSSSPQYNTKKPDIDNYIKFYLDCMNKVCYTDDSQIISLMSTKEYVDEKSLPYTEIIITKVDNY